MIRIVESAAAALRLDEAHAFVQHLRSLISSSHRRRLAGRG